MLQLLSRKWRVLLLQGILLIILSIYIFQNPVAVLTGISLWSGLVVFATGLLGIIADKPERKEGMSLFWSILTVALGLLMLLQLFATMKILTVIFGLWVLVTNVLLAQSGWSLKRTNFIWMGNGYCRRVISRGGCHDDFQRGD